MSTPTYLLVHGAWGGAWCWRDVGAELDRRGVTWRAVDLPSSRNGADPETGLAEDAAAVAALIPSPGECATDASKRIRVRTLLDDAIEIDGEYLRLNPDAAIPALYNECTPSVAQWAVEQLSTQTIASFRSHRESENALTETIYIRCANDHAVDPELQQLMSEECDFAMTLESDHSPFLCHPSSFCDAILG